MPYMQHLKVMVVDDTSVSRMLLVDGLNEIGIKNITLAGDGEQALQSMMASPCHIVFSDMNMPKLNGLQLLKALRDQMSDISIILLTAQGTVETAVEAIVLPPPDSSLPLA